MAIVSSHGNTILMAIISSHANTVLTIVNGHERVGTMQSPHHKVVSEYMKTKLNDGKRPGHAIMGNRNQKCHNHSFKMLINWQYTVLHISKYMSALK